jgi:hypothetical protein
VSPLEREVIGLARALVDRSPSARAHLWGCSWIRRAIPAPQPISRKSPLWTQRLKSAKVEPGGKVPLYFLKWSLYRCDHTEVRRSYTRAG